MSTRKLILLALVCGLAILLAGGVKLFQIVADEPRVELLRLGQAAEVGDMTVTVYAIHDGGEVTLVDVELVGVDGAVVAEGWTLLAEGTPRAPVELPDGVGVACPATDTDRPVRCTVAFDAAERVQAVAYRRGDQQRQWVTPG